MSSLVKGVPLWVIYPQILPMWGEIVGEKGGERGREGDRKKRKKIKVLRGRSNGTRGNKMNTP